MKTLILIATTMLLLVVDGNAQQSPSKQTSTVELSQAVEQIVGRVQRLEELVKEYRERLDELPRSWASLLAGDSTFRVIYTKAGLVAVGIGETSPYPGGYKIEFQIMPLSPIAYDSGTLRIAHGSSLKTLNYDYRKYLDRQQLAVPVAKKLVGGQWSTIPVVLAGAKSMDVEEFDITFEPGVMSRLKSPSLYGLGAQ